MSPQRDDALLVALELADAEGVRRALAAGAEPDACRDGRTFAIEIALAADWAAVEPESSPSERATSSTLIELLLDAGADRTKLWNSLHWAVSLDRADLVRRFLASPIEEDQRHMLAALCLAASRGREDVLDALFESGIRPTGVPSGSPVAEALESGQSGVFRRFIDHRLWLDAKDIRGRTPLLIASSTGDLAALVALLEAGANADLAGNFRVRQDDESVCTFEQSTPVHVAIRSGHGAIAEALIKAGADPNRRDGAGRTAFDWAEDTGRDDLFEILRQPGARPLPPPPELAIVIAADRGDTARLKAALEAGAAVDSRDVRVPTRGMTPLMLAARAGHVACVRILIGAGASVALHDDPTRTSQGAAMAFESHETSESLRDLNVCPKRTALHYAAENGHSEVVTALLAAGAAPSPKDFRQLAPLHLAVLGGHLEAVKALLAGRARVTVTDIDKETPLHLAASLGHLPVARELLVAGARPERPDSLRRTPLRIAEINRDLEMIDLLKSPPRRSGR